MKHIGKLAVARHSSRLFGWMIFCLVVSGCNTAPSRDPEFAAVRPRPAAAPPPSDGAIYQPGYSLVLFEDLRARRVGDVLTISLNERTAASKSAETEFDKSTSTTISNPTVLGSTVSFNVPSVLPLSTTANNTLEASLNSSSDFEGGGQSTQSNSLTGDITVTVAEVLPNGDLFVQGEKILTLTEGHEHIRISGTVRQVDITPENTVLSTRVANARIIYAGEGGGVPDANIAGWLARFFVSAFFPF